MAINDPRYIGIAVRCIKCRWIFRCPAEQPYRARCYSCTTLRTSRETFLDEINVQIEEMLHRYQNSTRELRIAMDRLEEAVMWMRKANGQDVSKINQ